MNSVQTLKQNEGGNIERSNYVTDISTKSPVSDRIIELEAIPTKLISHKSDIALAIDMMLDEGYSLPNLIIHKDQIPLYIQIAKNKVEKYKADLDQRIRSNGSLSYIHVDADKHSTLEITDRIQRSFKQIEDVGEWELQSLDKFVNTIESLLEYFQPQRLDADCFMDHYQKLVSSIELLKSNSNPTLIPNIRCEIRYEAIRTMLGLMLKHVPRFYRDINTREIVIDSNSSTWSPDYYRMAESNVEQSLIKFILGKTILDPFGGAGSMTSVITAHGIPSKVFYSDLSYSGGIGINNQPYNYDPVYNISMIGQLFRDLPSWYKPEFDKVGTIVTANASQLPFAENSVDFIFGDPPYGRTLKNGGVPLFMTFLPELLRVSREGGVFMVPLEWIDGLNKTGIKYEQITGDPSYGGSGYPICYIYVSKNLNY